MKEKHGEERDKAKEDRRTYKQADRNRLLLSDAESESESCEVDKGGMGEGGRPPVWPRPWVAIMTSICRAACVWLSGEGWKREREEREMCVCAQL